ncbi:Primase C terminal 2 (PriCT-2) [Paracoccus isoporae]|uniref:Primase C terminal 2 (PriCT-2) n=1 Tax=Paracoccus isoporae TaxID=591205 RepID=A0A1G7H8T0_9RHOB|nr:bifunctional DNA primase/polymerase [Paracoccus isoporae]SDE96529.1 Primase C terminal 2 (PriCT-2) [Paracoccus isoporae]
MNIPFNIFPVGPDKAPLVTGWQDKATKDTATIAQWQAQGARAWGIPTGARNGLFVIDLDVDKETGERIGRDSLLAMPRYASLYDHAYVMTPSGGRHIYCQHFEGARNSTSKIGPKIDTRGEGGYVVAPGSQVAGGFYAGSVPQFFPKVPMGLRAMLLHTPPSPQRSFDRITPKGEVEELLAHIPADLPYQDWVSVLMALHERFGGSEEGLALADRWSATGQKYRKGDVAAKWRSFKRNGVSWATVPALARQYGADLSDIARRWAA